MGPCSLVADGEPRGLSRLGFRRQTEEIEQAAFPPVAGIPGLVLVEVAGITLLVVGAVRLLRRRGAAYGSSAFSNRQSSVMDAA